MRPPSRFAEPSGAPTPVVTTTAGYTISIVSHGHGAILKHALAQIAAFSPPPDLVIVTLNLENEVFDQARCGSLHVTVLRNRTPKGFGANHNTAFSLCRSPWFAVLNPDLRFDYGNPFTSLMPAVSRHPGIGLIAPRILGPGGAAEDAVRDNLTPWSLAKRALLRQRAPGDMPDLIRRPARFHWLAGMFMLLDASAFRQVKGFDERFFLYCEDFDLCARLYLAGFGLAVDRTSAVVHDAQRDSHRSGRHLRWHLESLGRVWSSRAFWSIVFSNTSASDRGS